jgi:hypothetical protein
MKLTELKQAKEFLPPEPYVQNSRISVFLAGSIEMGKAEDWQTKVINDLKNFDVDILNPRRRDWDSSWEQSINNKQFSEQVNWELDSLIKSDVILLYLQPNTQSPISLLELGLFADKNKVIVCCPNGFWRKGNVDIVCNRFDIPVFETLDEAVKELKKRFTTMV